jgi:mRNA interferase MazF
VEITSRYMKDFTPWIKQKTKIEARPAVPQFSERDIWWCALGLNVGFEEDGKNEHFERPVCVLRKFNKDSFLGLPLTSTQKDNDYYFPYQLHGKDGSILLSQARLFSAKRLERRLGHMGRGKFAELRKRYRKLFH